MEKENEFYKAEWNKIHRLLNEKIKESHEKGLPQEAEHLLNCIHVLNSLTFGEPKVLMYGQMQSDCGQCESVDYQKGIKLYFKYLDFVSTTKSLLTENGVINVDIPIS